MFFSVITKNLIWAFTKNQYIGWNWLGGGEGEGGRACEKEYGCF